KKLQFFNNPSQRSNINQELSLLILPSKLLDAITLTGLNVHNPDGSIDNVKQNAILLKDNGEIKQYIEDIIELFREYQQSLSTSVPSESIFDVKYDFNGILGQLEAALDLMGMTHPPMPNDAASLAGFVMTGGAETAN